MAAFAVLPDVFKQQLNLFITQEDKLLLMDTNLIYGLNGVAVANDGVPAQEVIDSIYIAQHVVERFVVSTRKGLKFKRVLRELQGSVIWDDIALHYEKKNTTETQLIERLRDSYQERILMGYSI